MYNIKAVRWLSHLYICLYSRSLIRDFSISPAQLTNTINYTNNPTIVNIKSALLTIPFPE